MKYFKIICAFIILAAIITAIAVTVYSFKNKKLSINGQYDSAFMGDFAALPVLHEGRIKPLDSFARVTLRSIHGKDTFEGQSALRWLAGVMFAPEEHVHDKVFKVAPKSLRVQYGFDDSRRYYSFHELEGFLSETGALALDLSQQADNTLTPEQESFLNIHHNIQIYMDLMRSFSLYFPVRSAVPVDVAVANRNGQTIRYIDVLAQQAHLTARVKTIVQNKGEDLSAYTEEERTLALLSFEVDTVRAGGERNQNPRVWPLLWAGNEREKRQEENVGTGTAMAVIDTNASEEAQSVQTDFLSPWPYLLQGKAGPQAERYLDIWGNMVEAYRAQDWPRWKIETAAALQEIEGKMNHSVSVMRWEILYSAVKPFGLAVILYVLCALSGAAVTFLNDIVPHRALSTLPHTDGHYRAPLTVRTPVLVWLEKIKSACTFLVQPLFILAIISHLFGLISRIVILARPPVGTLYESLLYVGLIAALGTVFFIMRRGAGGAGMAAARAASYAASNHVAPDNGRDNAHNDEHAQQHTDAMVAAYFHVKTSRVQAMIGAVIAGGLLLIAPYVAGQGDDMGVLVAVLNTNFWLATHVTIITAGYGVCMMAACAAHVYLYDIWRFGTDVRADALQSRVHYLTLFALFLTGLGTALGGVWADQSWGRFWGWDPKENGALLIVLWIIWIQHGRLSGYFHPVHFAFAAGILNIIVALAWFGVNLLGVGLHSYGFITGVALALGTFCSVQMALLVFLWRGALGNYTPPSQKK